MGGSCYYFDINPTSNWNKHHNYMQYIHISVALDFHHSQVLKLKIGTIASIYILVDKIVYKLGPI